MRKETSCFVIAFLALASGLAGNAFAECLPVGGTFSTNIGVVDANSTLGVSTGDLAGALGVHILSIGPGPNNTTVLAVQHYWVTNAGDTIQVNQAQATGVMVTPDIFALINYPVTIAGGTGRFKKATGKLTAIGEANFATGQIVGRYSGTVCYGN
jgi:hypothetical protein